MKRAILGEFLGTFLLVFIGCGSVAWSILIQDLSLAVIASTWGVGVCLAIILSSQFSRAHLNPAVTIGFWISSDFEAKNIITYFAGQMLGSFTAALSLYIIFASYITAPSIETARFFGEYFIETESFNIWSAMGVEAIGTFLLMFGIYLILKINIKQSKFVHPILIGFLLSILIFFLAPYTQAGFNPARDFMPRLLSYFSGWDMAFSANGIGWLTVYIVSPIVGSVSAALLYIRLLGKGR